ncbi:MAG: hypothetical protein ACI4RM_02510 [Ruminococcus sp.]
MARKRGGRMTPQEAIETIEIAIAEVECEYPMNYAVAFEVAINALKKQIPNEVKSKASEIDGFTDNTCPVCNGYLLSETNNCSYCGQALDWGDEV